MLKTEKTMDSHPLKSMTHGLVKSFTRKSLPTATKMQYIGNTAFCRNQLNGSLNVATKHYISRSAENEEICQERRIRTKKSSVALRAHILRFHV